MVIIKKCTDHLQSKWELKKQVEEEFCVNVEHFLWLARTHLVNLRVMRMMVLMVMVVEVMVVVVVMLVRLCINIQYKTY